MRQKGDKRTRVLRRFWSEGLQKGVCLGLIVLLFIAGLSGCGAQGVGGEQGAQIQEDQRTQGEQDSERELHYIGGSLISDRPVIIPAETDKYRTFYEIFVYSFCDSDGDGIGDLRGVNQKLDYLNDGDVLTDTDLGVTGIWLMPIMPSDTYHKYDVKDYMAIDPAYGTMEDFEALIAECKERDINVIIDLVMNHTSSSHPWFQTACEYLQQLGDNEASLEDCPYLDYYNFNQGMKWGYSQVPGTDWYYEAQFWSKMPDLNLYSEAVRAEFQEICQFWLDKGVAGFRLDAVKEFVSDNTEANVEILTWLNDMVKEINPDAYLVGEAWASQADYAQYYASGMDSLFDFVFAGEEGRIARFVNGQYMAYQYGDSVESAEQRYASFNENFVNAPFYTNHDMDRGAGYYVGENALAQTKMAIALNLTMSGNAFLYYGDEIGMMGAGIDENKRLGMRWSADDSGTGTCDGPAAAESVQQIYGSVEEQQEEADSLYWFTKNLIRLRNQFPAIAKGATTNLKEASDNELSVIEKSYGGERVCVIYNISAVEKTLELGTVVLSDGSVLEAGQLESALVTGETSVTVEEGVMTLPAYSLAVFLIAEEEG